MTELVAVARRHGLPIHLDGARLFNAAVALGVDPRDLAAPFDSVMVSLSKGLGAPVGSLLCASAARIREARRIRKMFGGGMRQVGVLAAAGLVALRRGFAHLAADHENARWLAQEVAALPGIELDPETVETNIVIFEVGAAFFGGRTPDPAPAPALVARAREKDLLAVPLSPTSVRFVTHRDVPRPKIERAAEILRSLAS
jgi:threonine aldolase